MAILTETDCSNKSDNVLLTLLVACYNEQDNLEDTLDTLLSALGNFDFSWEIIIADDGSVDNSATVAKSYICRNNRFPLRLVVNTVNQGLAQTYIDGAFLGRGEYFRLVCGDNVESKETFIKIFERLGDKDMIVPFHYGSTKRSLHRSAISSLYTKIVNAISGYNLKYYNGMAVLRRRDVMRWHTNYHGFGFQADMLVRLLDVGRTYVEVPVLVSDRNAGTSSAFRFKNILSVSHTLLDLSIRRLGRELYPARRRRPSPSIASAAVRQRPAIADERLT
ncbi:MAG: glycosyltransferase family 2 protein [Xanthobacteraceae bacterium]